MSFLKFNENEHEFQIFNDMFDKFQNKYDNIKNTVPKHTVYSHEVAASKGGNKPKIFCIDGNIGSGKSTILDELKTRGYVVFKENIEEWLSTLTLFYNDPKRWMFTLQVKIALSMRRQYKEICDLVSEKFVFVERSPLSTLLFIKNGIRNGYLTFEEMCVFIEIFNNNLWISDNVFFIDTPVDVCFQRKQKRDRKCEKSIEIAYLQQLNDEYKAMYTSSDFTSIQQTINGTRDVKTITNEILENVYNMI